ncbi:MAG: zinc-binding dehydrogenase, partial [Planctomycetota bacterium]|nr:zinc-binding dehydrogenase [Planctomycetota bacterium]
ITIIGSGAIALLHLQLALIQGAEEIIVIGSGEKRLQTALDLGAWRVIDRKQEEPEEVVRTVTRGYGPDTVIECAGDPEAWSLALRMVRKGGKVLLFGGCAADSEVTFGTEKIHYGEVTILGSFHFTPKDVRESLELLLRGDVKGAPLITAVIRLEDVEAGLQSMMNSDCLKLAIQPVESN